ncbi:L,D-transpeptidase family protein [Nocardioides sp.]|uniref:L,D-transpeptidase family protein n=1 Tax=Nocardioides sp. TaxID=35761 RepID=UPI003517FD0C
MTAVRRLALTVLVALVLGGTVLALTANGLLSSDREVTRAASARTQDGDRPRDRGTATPEPTEPAEPSQPTEPTEPSQPTEPAGPVAGPALFSPGDEGPQVREIQARLRQIDWFAADVTGYYGDVTTEAVRGFQAKRGFAATGVVDRTTLDRLEEMTTEPTTEELENRLGENVPGPLDPRCETGRVLCVDKTSRTLRWVVDGRVLTTLDVRFGSEYTPTREGLFHVEYKSRDHVSSLYGSSMPFAMFFSGGQAVHYSSDFAGVGYAGASHGCVNVRDYDALAALFDQVQVGDDVVVYWS